MKGQDLIDSIKRDYRFKEGYKLIVRADGNTYSGFAFREIPVSSKKDRGITEVCVETIETDNGGKFLLFVETYCDKI